MVGEGFLGCPATFLVEVAKALAERDAMRCADSLILQRFRYADNESHSWHGNVDATGMLPVHGDWEGSSA